MHFTLVVLCIGALSSPAPASRLPELENGLLAASEISKTKSLEGEITNLQDNEGGRTSIQVLDTFKTRTLTGTIDKDTKFPDAKLQRGDLKRGLRVKITVKDGHVEEITPA